MTPTSAGNDHLPVYESLVRERGDAVAEARVVAEETQRQVTQAMNWHDAVRPPDGPTRSPYGLHHAGRNGSQEQDGGGDRDERKPPGVEAHT